MAIGSDRQFNDLCGLLKIENKYPTNVDRVRNRKELGDVIASKIRVLSFDQLSKDINRLKIPAGAIQDLRQVFELPEARELLVSAGGLKGVRSFVASSSHFPKNTLTPPPHLGQHNDEILRSL